MQFNYLMAGSKCPRVQCDRPVLTDQSEAGIGWLDSAGNVKNNKVLSINGYCISATWCCCHFKRLAFSYIEANESSQPKWQQVFCSLFSVCVWIEKNTSIFPFYICCNWGLRPLWITLHRTQQVVTQVCHYLFKANANVMFQYKDMHWGLLLLRFWPNGFIFTKLSSLIVQLRP